MWHFKADSFKTNQAAPTITTQHLYYTSDHIVRASCKDAKLNEIKGNGG